MTPALRAYLVDDEPLALQRLTRLLSGRPDVSVIGSTTDPLEAVAAVDRLAPDLLFLDIQMPDVDGFELLTRVARQPWVIFTTAFDEYALRAFDVNSIDYLLKPVLRERLERALDKLASLRVGERPGEDEILRELAKRLRSREPVWLERIASCTANRTRILATRRVSHFLAEDKLTFAVVEGERLVVNDSLHGLEARLDPSRFLRIHRSVLVNLDYVGELHAFFGGRLLVRLKDRSETDLPVARDRAGELRRRLGL